MNPRNLSSSKDFAFISNPTQPNDTSQSQLSYLLLTFEITDGSSRKLNFDDNAPPDQMFQGIKMLNIIRWISKRFDPVLVEHHGLAEMSRMSANH